MTRRHFNLPNNLNALHEAILSARPDLAEVLRVEGLGDDIWITAPDADDAAMAAMVAAHNPALLTPAQQVVQRREQAKQAYKTLSAIRGMTPEQAQAWVVANVTTVATARAVMGQMAYALIALVRYLDIED